MTDNIGVIHSIIETYQPEIYLEKSRFKAIISDLLNDDKKMQKILYAIIENNGASRLYNVKDASIDQITIELNKISNKISDDSLIPIELVKEGVNLLAKGLNIKVELNIQTTPPPPPPAPTPTVEENWDLTQLFIKSSEGNLIAKYKLGKCYENADGVNKDDNKAVELYMISAENGHAPAQNTLGNCYKNGYVVKQDYAKAREWYTKAANQGNEYALESLVNL